MKAIRYYAPEDVRVEDVPKPVAAEGEALIKVLYSGICGSDLHNYTLGMFMTYAPETMGHEFVGVIETAPEDSGFVPEDMVLANPSVFCHECPSCAKGDFIHCENIGFIGEGRPGSDAEYVALPADTLIKLKADVDPVQAGIIEPLTVAHHTCKKVMEHGEGNAAVYGCGPIGLLVAYLLKNMYHLPKVVLIDMNENRVRQAKEAGFEDVATSIDAFPGEYGIAVDTTGAGPALNAEMAILKPLGTLVIMSIFEKLPTLDANMLVDKELKIIGATLYTHEDMKEAAKIVESGDYDFRWIVTKIAKPEEAPETFRDLREKRNELKILFDFN